ncbi:MAG: hypothetical protein HN396_14735 [Gemmatimonadales bacterium]|mgnify:FL=1|nr:hypothetical protein [Gemmatimonadales bacterium]MBT3497768.1 hypothetical protein [Gemmatimonadales bacterium]MBT3773088.1 hypothetical protein [Gemmatimonadales bacterium]MBT3958836.1 hypothetical protein [Gemmatimonadales bacterium]MBT4437809.1 hypothetical protein [Gemmatimonadales bacterium]
MKVTLDIGKLLAGDDITQEEHDRLLALARTQSQKHVWGVLAVMATIATVLGAIGLFPEYFEVLFEAVSETVLALYRATGRLGFYFLVFLALVGIGTLRRSGFLIGLSCFAVASLLGGTTGYSHASYWVVIEEPAVTTVVFSVLAMAGLFVSLRVGSELERLAIIFSRTCLIFVNLAFWVGSLWGSSSPIGGVPKAAFAVLWAIGLVVTMIWAARVGRLWVVNAAITFGVIHFYTQYFEYLGATPGSLLFSGLSVLGLIAAVRRYRRGLPVPS